MISRRLSVIFLAGFFAVSSAGISYGISGEGYFGKDKTPPDGIIPEMPVPAAVDNKPLQAEQQQPGVPESDDTEVPAAAAESKDTPVPTSAPESKDTPAPASAPETKDTPAPAPETTDTSETTPAALPEHNPKQRQNYERYSEDPGKVIPSYGLDETTTLALIDLHHSASRGPGKRERFERYVLILNDYPQDYLAAYMASRNAYDMADYETSMKWLNKALEIFPQYNPARSFKKKIEGGLKRKPTE